MIHPFLTNQSLERFIRETPMDEEQKQALLERLPYLDEQDRQRLFEVLKDITLLEIEKDDILKSLKPQQQRRIMAKSA